MSSEPGTGAQAGKPSKPPRKRPYLRHGLTALDAALKRVADDDWTAQLGPVGAALRAWRGDLIEALGGETAVSPQQRSLIELATRTHLMVESVDRFILAMPSLVNKSKRSIFAVVRERQQLADALARYLSLLGLERRPKPVRSLDDVLREMQQEDETQIVPQDRAAQEGAQSVTAASS